jgi:hypothetical protein
MDALRLAIEARANRGEISRQEQYTLLCELARLRQTRGVEVTPKAMEGMASIILGMLWVGGPLRLALPVITMPELAPRYDPEGYEE